MADRLLLASFLTGALIVLVVYVKNQHHIPPPGTMWDDIYFYVATVFIAFWSPELAALLATGITAALAVHRAKEIFG